jgi:hypothetical protein
MLSAFRCFASVRLILFASRLSNAFGSRGKGEKREKSLAAQEPVPQHLAERRERRGRSGKGKGDRLREEADGVRHGAKHQDS